MLPGEKSSIETTVNGDPGYPARTMRRAIANFLGSFGLTSGRMSVKQSVDVPIGAGFGASAASALSAVYAAAAAFEIDAGREELARCAHDAEIAEQTGLGTVSVIYRGTGAGAIITPGVPGQSRFVNVRIPAGTRVVTASLAPFDKAKAFASSKTSDDIVTLGNGALSRFRRDPSIRTLASEGELFSDRLGLESPAVRKLIRAAKVAGADFASQNMIGHAVHAIVKEEIVGRVADGLTGTRLNPRVDVFEVGTVGAGTL